MRQYGLAIFLAFMATTVAMAGVPEDPKAYYSPDTFKLDALPHYVPTQTVTGTIRIWGSGYIGAGKTTRYWEAGFRKFHPGVKFEYTLGESLNAVPSVYAGAADIGSGPRISWNDLKAFNHSLGYDPLQIMIMSGSYNVPGWNPAFAIFVHKDNPIAHLSMQQLDRIFGSARDGGWVGIVWHPELAREAKDNIRTWGQLGLGGVWADRPIHVYGANFRYGISGTFSNQVLYGSDSWNEQMHVFTNKPDKTKPDDTYLAVDQIVDAIASDPDGIGFAGVSFDSPRTKILDIAAQDGDAPVKLTLANVQNRTYPLADESYMFLNRPPGQKLDPKLREYLRYILSREGQEDIVRDGKYLPLPADLAKRERRKLD